MKKEVDLRLEDVDLSDARDIPAGAYSGGMRRRSALLSLFNIFNENWCPHSPFSLSVAIALIGDPAIVILDEPTTGMDPVSRRKVWNLIERVRIRPSIILFSSHPQSSLKFMNFSLFLHHLARISILIVALSPKLLLLPAREDTPTDAEFR